MFFKTFVKSSHLLSLNLALPGFVVFVFNDVHANCQEKFPSQSITDMNHKASFGKQIPHQTAVFYTLRCAGLFNLQASVHFISEAWVSLQCSPT